MPSEDDKCVSRQSTANEYSSDDFSSVLLDGRFGDFTIICQGLSFKEAIACSVDLSDIDPAILVRGLMYMYTNDYTSIWIGKEIPRDSQFREIEDNHSGRERTSMQMLHAQMYVLGDRWLDSWLQETARLEYLSLNDFSSDCCTQGACAITAQDIDVISFIYANTPNSDEGIRFSVRHRIQSWRRFHEAQSWDKMSELLLAVPELGLELFRWPLLEKIVKRNCPDCGPYDDTAIGHSWDCDCGDIIEKCTADCWAKSLPDKRCFRCDRKYKRSLTKS